MNPLKEKIVVRVNNFNFEHFSSLGYVVNLNEYIEIFVEELSTGSGTKIDVECNYCGKIFKKSYRRFLETKNDICCNDCKKFKSMKTCLDKYGTTCTLTNEEIQQKSKDKNMRNLGVQYPFQSMKILEKAKETSVERYGHAYQTSSISKQQRLMNVLFGGILNYSMFPYRLDIFFEEEKIYFEYDGSGHEMGISMGRKTRDEFESGEIKRRNFLKEKGIKEFRILSNDDVLPSNEELIDIKNKAFNILIEKKQQWYFYDLNTKTESFGK